jgi:hypothetical protein
MISSIVFVLPVPPARQHGHAYRSIGSPSEKAELQPVLTLLADTAQEAARIQRTAVEQATRAGALPTRRAGRPGTRGNRARGYGDATVASTGARWVAAQRRGRDCPPAGWLVRNRQHSRARACSGRTPGTPVLPGGYLGNRMAATFGNSLAKRTARGTDRLCLG